MTSTTANNNPTSSGQSTQFASSGLASLGSLANAIEPNGFSFNQQPSSVGSFSQKPTGGASTVCFHLYFYSFINFLFIR